MQDHKSSLIASMEKIMAGGALDSETCLFFSQIYGLQKDTGEKLKDGVYLPRLIVESGLAIDASLLRIDESALEILKKAFDEISGVMLSRFQGFDSSIIRQTMATRPLYIEKVIAHLIEKKTKNLHNLANNAGMQFDDFMFLMINWLKPVFLALRDKYPANGVVEHDGGTCPFCGYYPDMGISIAGAREDRYLRCGLCETLWKTAELSCPACGESSAEKLENFMAGDGRFMAEACHSCGGYIKMLLAEDPGSLADLDLTVESLSSISFDEMMQRKGFNRQ